MGVIQTLMKMKVSTISSAILLCLCLFFTMVSSQRATAVNQPALGPNFASDEEIRNADRNSGPQPEPEGSGRPNSLGTVPSSSLVTLVILTIFTAFRGH